MKSNSDFALNEKYVEQVYAGVLGKIIGVYAGKPFEQWSSNRIESELGEITGYVHDKFGQPIVQTDDDISGTFNFLRALPENGNSPDLTSKQIGDWWLNSIIKGRSILWWGGFGISTEHTAYLRLLDGHKAPESGSTALNGTAVAEEIGSQIFIDGWGLISPGNPEQSVEFARKAASVSHDGEAIYGAQVVAALVSLAFVSADIKSNIRRAQQYIPSESIISKLIDELFVWSERHGAEWRKTLWKIQEFYPYSRFGTNCPMVSNHAIVLMALLHGDSEFSKSLMIANTAGYDTDCNSGNVGCILGVMNGLSGLDAGYDWRGPVADRLYVAAADGGRCVTDAVREAFEIANSGRALTGLPPIRPKNGARYHFSLPGSVQGFAVTSSELSATVGTITNLDGKLAVPFKSSEAGSGLRVSAPVFLPPTDLNITGYSLAASPTIYSGQTINAAVSGLTNLTGFISARICVDVYSLGNSLVTLRGPMDSVKRGRETVLSMLVPDTGGSPVASVGIELFQSTDMASSGTVLLDWLSINGTPDVVLRKPAGEGSAWLKAWVNGVDEFDGNWVFPPELTYRVVQNEGIGMVTQGTSEWNNYDVSVQVAPHLSRRVGLAVAVRGLRRYLALVLDSDKKIRLIRQFDDELTVLAESDQMWQYERLVTLRIFLKDSTVYAEDGVSKMSAQISGDDLSGAIGLLVEQGHAGFGPVTVRPVGDALAFFT